MNDDSHDFCLPFKLFYGWAKVRMTRTSFELMELFYFRSSKIASQKKGEKEESRKERVIGMGHPSWERLEEVEVERQKVKRGRSGEIEVVEERD